MRGLSNCICLKTILSVFRRMIESDREWWARGWCTESVARPETNRYSPLFAFVISGCLNHSDSEYQTWMVCLKTPLWRENSKLLVAFLCLWLTLDGKNFLLRNTMAIAISIGDIMQAIHVGRSIKAVRQMQISAVRKVRFGKPLTENKTAGRRSFWGAFQMHSRF